MTQITTSSGDSELRDRNKFTEIWFCWIPETVIFVRLHDRACQRARSQFINAVTFGPCNKRHRSIS